MRAKKLQRQLSKSLDYEDVETDLPQLKEWLMTVKDSNPYAEKLHTACENLPALFDAVESSYEQLECNLKHATTSLELSGKEVEERNRALRTEVKKVSNLLNNMKQAVFSVDVNGLIVGPVSKYADLVFGNQIEGVNIFESLYSSIPKDSEVFASLKSAYIAVFGEGELQWDLMSDHFPPRIIKQKDGSEQILKVTTNPLWDDNQNLERLMLIVEDITELEALNRRVEVEKEKSGRNLTVVQELIALERSDVFSFISKTDEMLTEIKKVLQAGHLDREALNVTFRHMHTIKGNSRSYGLSLLSAVTHKIETEFVKLREMPNITSEALQSFGAQYFPGLEDQYIQYKDMVFKLFSGSEKSSSLGEEKYLQLLNLLEGHKAKLGDSAFGQLRDSVQDLLEKSQSAILKKNLTMIISKASQELEKPIDFEFVAQGIQLPEDDFKLLESSLMHIVVNAIDHGVESADKRNEARKSPRGKIRFESVNKGDRLELKISDDGRGIEIESLKKTLFKKGLAREEDLRQLSSSQIFQYLFLPGFSTRETASETSGRGVGLDVVKSNLNFMKGDVQIQSTPGQGTQFLLSLPLKSDHRQVAA